MGTRVLDCILKGHCSRVSANALFPIYQQASCLETCVLWAQSKYVSASVIRKTPSTCILRFFPLLVCVLLYFHACFQSTSITFCIKLINLTRFFQYRHLGFKISTLKFKNLETEFFGRSFFQQYFFFNCCRYRRWFMLRKIENCR